MNEFVALRMRAKAAGLSLAALCGRLGVDRTTYFRWQKSGAVKLAHYRSLVAIVEAAEAAVAASCVDADMAPPPPKVASLR